MTRLMQQRITLTRIIVALDIEADNLGWYLGLDYVRRCEDCPVGHPQGAHKEARAVDIVLWHKSTGAVCEDDAVFSRLHDVADTLGAAKRIEGDLGHFSMADKEQVR